MWIDFLNPAAKAFWKKQYLGFKGTSSLYGIWIDMNEPSVFDGFESTFPMTNLHMNN